VVTKKEEKIGRKIGVVVVLSSDADRSSSRKICEKEKEKL
jgi:hypothetical protein